MLEAESAVESTYCRGLVAAEKTALVTFFLAFCTGIIAGLLLRDSTGHAPHLTAWLAGGSATFAIYTAVAAILSHASAAQLHEEVYFRGGQRSRVRLTAVLAEEAFFKEFSCQTYKSAWVMWMKLTAQLLLCGALMALPVGFDRPYAWVVAAGGLGAFMAVLLMAREPQPQPVP